MTVHYKATNYNLINLNIWVCLMWIRRGFVLCCILIAVAVDGYGQSADIRFTPDGSPPDEHKILRWHEVFTYEVRYSLFKLGEVKVEIVKDTLYQNKKAWHLQTIITSSPGVPFVGREENHYHSIFEQTDSLPHSLVFWTDNVDENEYEDSRYDFDYELLKVYGREEEETDTLDLEEPASSGQLIFVISRLFAGTNDSFRIPIYLNLEKGYIDVVNTTETEMRAYRAFPEPVETFFSEGESTIEGPFGFRGGFKAWFLADDLRVPLEAHARVWLGNVRIKIIDYQKELRR